MLPYVLFLADFQITEIIPVGIIGIPKQKCEGAHIKYL
jgi:hypothetical protein